MKFNSNGLFAHKLKKSYWKIT